MRVVARPAPAVGQVVIGFAASLDLGLLGAGLSPAPRSVIPTLDLGVLVGGFLLGVGLVVGGYCPGTALAGAAGGRIDAMLFFLMMYPGYRFWVWLEPRLAQGLHVPMAPRQMTVPDLLGVPPVLVLLGLGVACLLGWTLGDYLETRSGTRDMPGP